MKKESKEMIISSVLSIISLILITMNTIIKYSDSGIGYIIGRIIGSFIIPAIIGFIVLSKTKKMKSSFLVFSIASICYIMFLLKIR